MAFSRSNGFLQVIMLAAQIKTVASIALQEHKSRVALIFAYKYLVSNSRNSLNFLVFFQVRAIERPALAPVGSRNACFRTQQQWRTRASLCSR